MPSNSAPGILYVVATPIGNLEDMTLRGLRILKEAAVIAAEDTRHTRKLLAHFDIHTPLTSFHEHSAETTRGRLVDRLLAGESIALVSDAGTPGVNDPGHDLITDAVAAGVTVTPIPGASALLCAIVGSGLPMDRFRFEGFLPRRTAERRARLSSLVSVSETMVFFEAPHRLLKTLSDMSAVFGDRPACAARELTKIHEEFLRAPLPELSALLPETIRGEWSLVVAGSAAPPPETPAPADWRADLMRRLDAGESSRDASRAVADAHRLSRKEVYQEALSLKDNTGTGPSA
jgi:16S rRNA (cytidine1402-2'-O)-methyltransferase